MFSYAVGDDLSLAILTPRDVMPLYHLVDACRAHLREWLPWVDRTDAPHAMGAFIAASLQQFARNDGFQAGIWSKGQIVGVVGLHGIDWANRVTSVGYWLGEPYQGQGLMSRSVAGVVTMVFEHYELNRVEIRAAQDNHKSRAIPERLGFRAEGVVHQAEWLYDHFVDHVIYGLVVQDWTKASAL